MVYDLSIFLIEEKTHPEYLKDALKVPYQGGMPYQGKPVQNPSPVITDEMLEVVKDRHGYEHDKSRESVENEIKDKALKESKEKLKHARRIDKHGESIPLDSQSTEEEGSVVEEEGYEEENWEDKCRSLILLIGPLWAQV